MLKQQGVTDYVAEIFDGRIVDSPQLTIADLGIINNQLSVDDILQQAVGQRLVNLLNQEQDNVSKRLVKFDTEPKLSEVRKIIMQFYAEHFDRVEEINKGAYFGGVQAFKAGQYDILTYTQGDSEILFSEQTWAFNPKTTD